MKTTFLSVILLSLAVLTSGATDTLKADFAKSEKSVLSESNPPQDEKKKVVVVELFTSQSCASCPAADYFLSRLEESQPVQNVEVVTIAHHVDYYDAKTGWRDVFGSPLAAIRQAEYAKVLNLPQVFTPHFFIDGFKETGGSNMSKLQFTLIDAAKEPKADVRIKITDSNATFKKQKSVISDVEIDNFPKRTQEADVMIAITENGLITKIKKGENAGQDLKNDSVLRQISRVGTVTPDQNSFKGQAVFQPSNDWKKGNTHIVIFVQEKESRKIIGAARTLY